MPNIAPRCELWFLREEKKINSTTHVRKGPCQFQSDPAANARWNRNKASLLPCWYFFFWVEKIESCHRQQIRCRFFLFPISWPESWQFEKLARQDERSKDDIICVGRSEDDVGPHMFPYLQMPWGWADFRICNHGRTVVNFRSSLSSVK